MITSQRYHTIIATLQQQLPTLRPRLVEPLGMALTGMSQAVSGHQRAIARAMPLHTHQRSRIQRLRRLLDTPSLRPETIYQPIVRAALTGLRGQRVHLLLDRVVLTPHLNVLVVSVGFRRRSVPLVWQLLDHQGSSAYADQTPLLAAAAALLPESVRIVVHADSEFRSLTLFQWVRSQGWDAMLGVRGTLLVSTTATAPGQPLQTWLPHRDSVAYLNQVWVSEDNAGPYNLLAWWDKDDRGTVVCYGVLTNLPAQWRTYRLGSRRMWIETLFRDWQSGGFALGTCGITNHERFHRLLILVCLVYLWFISVGRWIVKRGARPLVDAGTSHQWDYSLFMLAVAWQQWRQAQEQPMPMFWYIYP